MSPCPSSCYSAVFGFFFNEDQKKKQPSLILQFPIIISFLHKMK